MFRDWIKCDFILNSIRATIIEDKVVNSNFKEAVAGPSSSRINSAPSENEISNSNDTLKNKVPTEVELIRLMSEVKEILCHLGEGFIEVKIFIIIQNVFQSIEI